MVSQDRRHLFGTPWLHHTLPTFCVHGFLNNCLNCRIITCSISSQVPTIQLRVQTIPDNVTTMQLLIPPPPLANAVTGSHNHGKEKVLGRLTLILKDVSSNPMNEHGHGALITQNTNGIAVFYIGDPDMIMPCLTCSNSLPGCSCAMHIYNSCSFYSVAWYVTGRLTVPAQLTHQLNATAEILLYTQVQYQSMQFWRELLGEACRDSDQYPASQPFGQCA